MKKIKRINLKQYDELMTIFNNYFYCVGLTGKYETLDEVLFNGYPYLLNINNDIGDNYTNVDYEPITVKIELFGTYSKYIIESIHPDELFYFLYNNKHLLNRTHCYIKVYTKLDYTDYELINTIFRFMI